MFLDDELYAIAVGEPNTAENPGEKIVKMIDVCKKRVDLSIGESNQDFKTSLKRINNSWNLCYDRVTKKYGQCFFIRDGFKDYNNDIFKDRADIQLLIWR